MTTATGLTPLPILPAPYTEGIARAVNGATTIVGYSWYGIVEAPRQVRTVYEAMRWKPDGTAEALTALIDPALGWSLGTAYAISEAGHIVGLGLLNGQWRGFLLTPIPSVPALAIRLNQSSFTPGHTLRVDRDLSNPGPILATDVYVGVILPDGVNTLFLTNLSPLEGSLTTLDNAPRTFARLLRGVSWPAGMRATQQDYFTHTFTGLEPGGTYHFLVGWTKPNSLEERYRSRVHRHLVASPCRDHNPPSRGICGRKVVCIGRQGHHRGGTDFRMVRMTCHTAPPKWAKLDHRGRRPGEEGVLDARR